MKKIAVMTEKGGAGKSTLATNLAAGLAKAGYSVVIADADPQGTSREWRELAGEDSSLPPVIGADQPDSFKSALTAIKADFLVIDTPARASKMSATVLANSDIVLVPIAPSGPDVWAVKPTVAMIQQRLDLGAQLSVGFVLNRLQPGRALGKEVLDGAWNEYDIPVLDTKIREREVYKTAITTGRSVYDFPGEARAEIDLLIAEILE